MSMQQLIFILISSFITDLSSKSQAVCRACCERDEGCAQSAWCTNSSLELPETSFTTEVQAFPHAELTLKNKTLLNPLCNISSNIVYAVYCPSGYLSVTGMLVAMVKLTSPLLSTDSKCCWNFYRLWCRKYCYSSEYLGCTHLYIYTGVGDFLRTLNIFLLKTQHFFFYMDQ